MRLHTAVILSSAVMGLSAAGAATAAELPIAPIGTGAKTCVPGPGADCRGVVQRWTLEHHGDLRKAKFTKADLTGANLTGTYLYVANLAGAILTGVKWVNTICPNGATSPPEAGCG